MAMGKFTYKIVDDLNGDEAIVASTVSLEVLVADIIDVERRDIFTVRYLQNIHLKEQFSAEKENWEVKLIKDLSDKPDEIKTLGNKKYVFNIGEFCDFFADIYDDNLLTPSLEIFNEISNCYKHTWDRAQEEDISFNEEIVKGVENHKITDEFFNNVQFRELQNNAIIFKSGSGNNYGISNTKAEMVRTYGKSAFVVYQSARRDRGGEDIDGLFRGCSLFIGYANLRLMIPMVDMSNISFGIDLLIDNEIYRLVNKEMKITEKKFNFVRLFLEIHDRMLRKHWDNTEALNRFKIKDFLKDNQYLKNGYVPDKALNAVIKKYKKEIMEKSGLCNDWDNSNIFCNALNTLFEILDNKRDSIYYAAFIALIGLRLPAALSAFEEFSEITHFEPKNHEKNRQLYNEMCYVHNAEPVNLDNDDYITEAKHLLSLIHEAKTLMEIEFLYVRLYIVLSIREYHLCKMDLYTYDSKYRMILLRFILKHVQITKISDWKANAAAGKFGGVLSASPTFEFKKLCNRITFKEIVDNGEFRLIISDECFIKYNELYSNLISSDYTYFFTTAFFSNLNMRSPLLHVQMILFRIHMSANPADMAQFNLFLSDMIKKFRDEKNIQSLIYLGHNILIYGLIMNGDYEYFFNVAKGINKIIGEINDGKSKKYFLTNCDQYQSFYDSLNAFQALKRLSTSKYLYVIKNITVKRIESFYESINEIVEESNDEKYEIRYKALVKEVMDAIQSDHDNLKELEKPIIAEIENKKKVVESSNPFIAIQQREAAKIAASREIKRKEEESKMKVEEEKKQLLQEIENAKKAVERAGLSISASIAAERQLSEAKEAYEEFANKHKEQCTISYEKVKQVKVSSFADLINSEKEKEEATNRKVAEEQRKAANEHIEQCRKYQEEQIQKAQPQERRERRNRFYDDGRAEPRPKQQFAPATRTAWGNVNLPQEEKPKQEQDKPKKEEVAPVFNPQRIESNPHRVEYKTISDTDKQKMPNRRNGKFDVYYPPKQEAPKQHIKPTAWANVVIAEPKEKIADALLSSAPKQEITYTPRRNTGNYHSKGQFAPYIPSQQEQDKPKKETHAQKRARQYREQSTQFRTYTPGK